MKDRVLGRRATSSPPMRLRHQDRWPLHPRPLSPPRMGEGWGGGAQRAGNHAEVLPILIFPRQGRRGINLLPWIRRLNWRLCHERRDTSE